MRYGLWGYTKQRWCVSWSRASSCFIGTLILYSDAALPARPRWLPSPPKEWILFCNLCLKKHETSQKMAGSRLVCHFPCWLSQMVENMDFFFLVMLYCRLHIQYLRGMGTWHLNVAMSMFCLFFFFFLQPSLSNGHRVVILPSPVDKWRHDYSAYFINLYLMSIKSIYDPSAVLHNIEHSWWDDHGACSESNAFLRCFNLSVFRPHHQPSRSMFIL